MIYNGFLQKPPQNHIKPSIGQIISSLVHITGKLSKKIGSSSIFLPKISLQFPLKSRIVQAYNSRWFSSY